jgi:hypothetical protein
MKATGFSFPCPCPARSKDEELERLLKTAKKDPHKIYNPYPQIARLKNLGQARTNPLSNIRYLSTITNPNSCLDEGLTCAHELKHLVSGHTPAKMLARLLLSQAFDSLSDLLGRFTWDSEIKKRWAEIVKINYDLSSICSAITLSEELVATAFSFEACSKLFSEDVKALRKKEEEIVKHTKLPDFERLYFQTFKKVMRWSFEEQGLSLGIFLEMFLQGIKISRSPRALRVEDGAECGLVVVDSTKRCQALAEWVNFISSGKALYDWLINTLHGTHEVTAFFTAWETLDDLKDLSEERKYLWIFMQGSDDLDKAEWTYNPPKQVSVVLEPLEFHKEWHITYTHNSTDESPQEEKRALVRILELESLLEQLSSGNGICCPHFDPWEGGCRCDCDPEWKASLNRIAQWAKEGKFDQGKFNRGNWKDLPLECRN